MASGSARSARLADFCDLYSVPGHGTVLVARFWPEPRSGPDSCAGLARPIEGEAECGDLFAVEESEGTLTGVLCDGLGHGPLAAIAANEAVHAVLDGPAGDPAAAVARAHSRMGHTRGGALAVVQVTGRLVRFCGLGNIAAVILANGTRKSMLSVPGIAGHQARAIRQFEYDAPPGAAVILHSDGLSSRWSPDSAARRHRPGPARRRGRAAGRGGDAPRRRERAGAQAMTEEFASLTVRDLSGVFAARQARPRAGGRAGT